jgi:hypothetical protein
MEVPRQLKFSYISPPKGLINLKALWITWNGITKGNSKIPETSFAGHANWKALRNLLRKHNRYLQA